MAKIHCKAELATIRRIRILKEGVYCNKKLNTCSAFKTLILTLLRAIAMRPRPRTPSPAKPRPCAMPWRQRFLPAPASTKLAEGPEEAGARTR